MPTLERSNPLPLYYQLKEVLKQQIRSGHLAPHTSIPSELALITSYHVSRATVRQALSELVHEGLLYRQHGKGTFVSEPRISQPLSELTSFMEEIRRRGQKPGGTLLGSGLIRGSEAVRKQLQLGDVDQVLRLERLRTADDVPVAHEVNYLPYPRAEGIYQRVQEVAEGSLYRLMAAEGLVPSIAEERMRGDSATVHEAELLRLPPGDAGLRLTCTTFDLTGTALAYTEAFYPGSRYDVHVTLRVAK